MTRIFVTSDLHFFHANIIELCKRPFTNVEIMNECLIENWNAKVEKDDLVIYCGDFALCAADNFDSVIHRLNGRKVLVKGNHDSRSNKFYLDNNRFAFVCDYFSMKNILFTHRPIEYQSICDSKWTESINAHGHIHNSRSEIIKKYEISDQKLFNVSCEVHDYFPITLEEIKERCKE